MLIFLLLAGTASLYSVGDARAEKIGLPFSLFSSAAGRDFASSGSPPLDLATCIRIAKEKNPSYRAAKESAVAAREAAGASLASYYPDVTANAGYRRFQTHAFLPNRVLSLPGVSTVVGPEDRWSADLRASYTLFDSGRRRADRKMAEAAAEVAGEDVERTRQIVAFNVALAYHNLLSAFEQRRIAQEHLIRAEDHLRLARERKAAGVVPQADVMRAQVEVANAKVRRVQAETAVQLSGGALNRAMGRSPEQELAIVRQAEPLVSPEEIDLQDAFARAKAMRPEIKAAQQSIERGKGGIAAARSTYGPEIRTEAGYGYLDSRFLPRDEDWAIGASLQWPIFSGFETRHLVARARAELARSQAQKDQTELSVLNEVWDAYAGVRETYSSVEAAETLKTDAAESLRLAQARYDAAAGTINDLLDAETSMENAEITHIRAVYDHQIALARLRLATGEL